MEKKPTLSTPTAILIGSGLIAVGLFLGLRQRPAPDDRSSSPTSTSDPAIAPTTGSAPARALDNPGREPSPAAPPAVVSNEVAVEQATKALNAYRDGILKKCWNPAVAKQPEPKTLNLVYNFSFDPSGNQITRGVREDRATSRPDVRECIDGLLQPLQISPPGAGIYVEVPLTLP